MMARTKRSRRSYGAGEWGRNRVRIFPDPRTGIIQGEWPRTVLGSLGRSSTATGGARSGRHMNSPRASPGR